MLRPGLDQFGRAGHDGLRRFEVVHEPFAALGCEPDPGLPRLASLGLDDALPAELAELSGQRGWGDAERFADEAKLAPAHLSEQGHDEQPRGREQYGIEITAEAADIDRSSLVACPGDHSSFLCRFVVVLRNGRQVPGEQPGT
jgi:hypothetical protein